ncbi:SDR family NAD(P)-dependent oxidoreductase [Arcticibacter sp.]|uniref:SDR family NAD(P)-dependent oxidoreductase n=1 Tax=Arcticibacter sp. TaxID=1872630 RepID=UPI00388E4206
MTFDFTNKTVLITGGSRGIGSLTAKLFAASGANVIITYQANKEAAEQVLAELGPGNHRIYQLDLADPTSIQQLFAWFQEHYDRLDILVNNAAVHLPHKILETDFDQWQQRWEDTLNANLIGPANMCYFASKLMVKQQAGKIINISSRGAFRGEPENPAYGASKAGINAMSQSLALVLAPHNISVHIIAPGFVSTEMAAEKLNGASGEAIKQQSPFERVAKPEEVARLVAVYASEGLEFTTAGIVDINGASYLRS